MSISFEKCDVSIAALCSVKDEWKLVNQLSIWLLYPSRKACGTRCLLSRISTLNWLFYLHRNVDFELTDTFVNSNNRQSQLFFYSKFLFIMWLVFLKLPRIIDQDYFGQNSASYVEQLTSPNVKLACCIYHRQTIRNILKWQPNYEVHKTISIFLEVEKVEVDIELPCFCTSYEKCAKCTEVTDWGNEVRSIQLWMFLCRA